MPEKAILSWSGGKDCCYALHLLNKNKSKRIKLLMTTLTSNYKRISMHGVREALLDRQVEALGIKLKKILLPPFPQNEAYEEAMRQAMIELKAQNFTKVLFADLFLKDIKSYRIKTISGSGINAAFPIWGMNTRRLAQDFINAGYKAVITCIDKRKLDKSFTGRQFDQSFLEDLPENTDPCGEYGEFHTFVYDGPVFQNEVKFNTREIVLKDQHFYFCDLIPKP